MDNFIASGGWSVFFLLAYYYLPVLTCCIIICICVQMPGCLLHNKELRTHRNGGRESRSANRLFDSHTRANQSYAQSLPTTPLSEPAPRVIIYSPAVPRTAHRDVHHASPGHTRVGLRDAAEAYGAAPRSRETVSHTQTDPQTEPPPPYNEAVAMQKCSFLTPIQEK